MDKVLSFLGLQDDQSAEKDAVQDKKENSKVKRGQLVEISKVKEWKIIIMEPQTFDEVQAIADHLKNGYPVIIRLGAAGKQLAKRIVDFLGGTTYALDGDFKRLGEAIFLCVPRSVTVETELHLDAEVSPEFWEPML
ncbi:MAG: cell division protein SepF [Limnochordia bacterium]|nr:cell division protein SepF [Limnochordia bacterium]MDD4518912.1 cell division protein SepF [Limnochordia bacterium]